MMSVWGPIGALIVNLPAAFVFTPCFNPLTFTLASSQWHVIRTCHSTIDDAILLSKGWRQ